MGWVVAIPAIAVWIVLNKRYRGKGRDKVKVGISYTLMGVAAIAGCGLAMTFVGRMIGGLVGWGSEQLASLGGDARIAFVIPFALAIAAILVAFADFWSDKEADGGAQFAMFILPVLLFLAVGGTLGAQGSEAVRTVNAEMSSIISEWG